MDQPGMIAESLGTCIEECVQGSLRAWRKEHAQRVRVPDLLGHELKNVELSGMLKRGGRVDIYVTVAARNDRRSDTYFFRLQRVEENRYTRVGSNLNA